MRADRFGQIVFLTLAALAAVVLAYVLVQADRLLTSPGRTAFFAGAPIGGILACLAALRLPVATRTFAATMTLSVVFGVYAAEAFLTARRPAVASPAPGVDPRTKYEVVRDLRAAGQQAYPAVFPNYLLQTGLDGRTRSPLSDADREVLPLGGIAGVETVLCNEGGPWITYPADEMGFNNPPGLWDRLPIEVLAIGDSFTQGGCVAPADAFVSLVRAQFPATINLGMSGSGPLLELSSLSEFGPRLKPRYVLWFLFEGNDFDDLTIERRSPLLMESLGPADGRILNRGLFGARARIDALLRNHVDAVIASDPQGGETNAGQLQSVISFAGLAALRQALALPTTLPAPDHDLVGRVLARAKAVTASWGGELILVYLPDFASLTGTGPAERIATLEDSHRRTLATAGELGLRVIDGRESLRGHPDPLALYPFRAAGHFNEAGHAAVAAIVLTVLEEAEKAMGLGRL